MLKSRILPFLLPAIALHWSCGKKHPHSDINLNNGEKWVVNAEMRPHIAKGDSILHAYIASNGEDYEQLAEDLKDQNKALVQSCTMQGASHDELHKWLHPHMELVGALAGAQNANEANSIIEKLELSFDTYSRYFQ